MRPRRAPQTGGRGWGRRDERPANGRVEVRIRIEAPAEAVRQRDSVAERTETPGARARFRCQAKMRLMTTRRPAPTRRAAGAAYLSRLSAASVSTGFRARPTLAPSGSRE